MHCLKNIFVLLLVSIPFLVKAQDIKFNTTYQGYELALNSAYTYEENPTTFSIFKFYISDVVLLHKGKVVYQPKERFHLIDFANPASQTITIDSKKRIKFDAIQFNLGIDSATNYAGAQDGALDPINGMYWTWQSGYINFKFEGHLDMDFNYHLGGFQQPNYAMQKVDLSFKKTKHIDINFEIESFLKSIDFENISTVMSPGINGNALSKAAANNFKVKR